MLFPLHLSLDYTMKGKGDHHVAQHLLGLVRNVRVERRISPGETQRNISALYNEIDVVRDKGGEVGRLSLNTVLQAMCRWGMPSAAERFHKEMAHIMPDHKTHAILIEGFSKTRSHDKVLEYIRDRAQHGLPPNTACMNAVLASLNKPNPTEMRKVLVSMNKRGLKPDSRTATFALLCCENVASAKGLWKREFVKVLKSGELDYIVFRVACRAGEVSAAVNLYISANVKKDAVSANMVLNAFAEARDWEGCLSFGRRVFLHKNAPDVLRNGVTPDVVPKTSLVPTSFTYATYLKACLRGEAPLHVAEQIFECAFTAKNCMNLAVATNMMTIFANRGATERAAGLYTLMKQSGYRLKKTLFEKEYERAMEAETKK